MNDGCLEHIYFSSNKTQCCVHLITVWRATVSRPQWLEARPRPQTEYESARQKCKARHAPSSPYKPTESRRTGKKPTEKTQADATGKATADGKSPSLFHYIFILFIRTFILVGSRSKLHLDSKSEVLSSLSTHLIRVMVHFQLYFMMRAKGSSQPRNSRICERGACAHKRCAQLDTKLIISNVQQLRKSFD